MAKPIMNMKEYGARFSPGHVYYFAIGHIWALLVFPPWVAHWPISRE